MGGPGRSRATVWEGEYETMSECGKRHNFVQVELCQVCVGCDGLHLE